MNPLFKITAEKELIPNKYFKQMNPIDAVDSFEALLEAHPEISCTHPDHTSQDEWRALPAPLWAEWMKTGVKPHRGIFR